MARKKGRRSKPFQLSIKKDTTNSIMALAIIGVGGLLMVSFLRQGMILDSIFRFGTNYIGWTYIFLPFIFIVGGLVLTKVRWAVASPHVLLGSVVTTVSLMALTQSGIIGDQIFTSIAMLFNQPGSYVFYTIGLLIGLFILFETSIEDLAMIVENIQKGVTGKKDLNGSVAQQQSLSGNKIKIRGLSLSDPHSGNKSDQVAKQPSLITVNEGRKIVPGVVPTKENREITVWQLPKVDLLSDEKPPKAERSDYKKDADTIEKTLASFGIDATVKEVNFGPAVTQFALEVSLGTKLSKINALQSDLALALAASQGQIRIESPIPGRSLVGIEIPNKTPEIVTLRQMLTSDVMTKNDSKTLVSLGLDVSGTPVVADIAKMPHVLIAGSTGSGKSVLVNALISTILFRATPDEVKFIMVDPKRVELTSYNDIPHLLTPVISDADKAKNALQWAVNEMENRYRMLAEVGVKNIASYNERMGFSSMYYIVIIIDELAALMLSARNEVENSIIKIAQMARAVGIHLVLATQRPSVDVLTGLIKANVPTRIAFNVASMVDSKVIIDGPGAEKLLGKGDMLFVPPDQAKPSRIQGVYVKDQEINNLIKFLKGTGAQPTYKKEILTFSAKKGGSSEGSDLTGDYDDKFEEAVRFCISTRKASASFLQRKLSIGYSRAAKIIDQMETAGIVAAGEGSKPREVLISSFEEFVNKEPTITNANSLISADNDEE